MTRWCSLGTVSGTSLLTLAVRSHSVPKVRVRVTGTALAVLCKVADRPFW